MDAFSFVVSPRKTNGESLSYSSISCGFIRKEVRTGRVIDLIISCESHYLFVVTYPVLRIEQGIHRSYPLLIMTNEDVLDCEFKTWL
jgi:hypothetical protein